MTNEQRDKILAMRRQCFSYSAIAETVGLTKDTVKSFCQRNDLGERFVQQLTEKGKNICPQCGGLVDQTSRTKRKRFCSAACRQTWWNANPGLVNRKAVYKYQCANCGKPFLAYGNRNRKYCCHACYVTARFGGGMPNDARAV